MRSQLLTSGAVGNIALKNQKIVREQIMERWSEYGFLEGLDGLNKENMATLFENQATSLITEATDTSSNGSFETVVFPIIRRVFSKLLANDIVSVQALNLPIGRIYYFLPKISTRTATNGHFKPDYYPQTGATTQFETRSLYDAYYEDNDPLFDRTRGAYTISSGASTAVQFSATTAGNVLVPASLEGCKRYAIIEVTGFTSTGAGKLTGPNGNEMDAEDFLSSLKVYNNGSIVGCGSNSGTTVFADQTSLDFRVVTQKYGKAIVEYGSRLGSTLNVCDATGKIYLEVDLLSPACIECDSTDGYSGSLLSSGNSFYATWRSYSDLEYEAELPEVTFDLEFTTISVIDRKLRAQWSPELATDVSNFHNIDAEAELTSILSEEISAEVDREIMIDLRKSAAWTRRWNYNGFKALAQGGSLFYTQKTWNQTLITEINKIDAQIYKSTLRSGTKFIVCGPQASAIFEDMSNFHVSNAAPEEDQYSMGIEKTGTMSGKYTVFRDPYFPENRILIGHKGSSMLDTGYVYAPYVPLQLTPTLQNPYTFANVKAISTRYAKKVVNNRFYGLVKLDGITVFDGRELR